VSPRLSDQLSFELLADEQEIRAARRAFAGWLGENGVDATLAAEIVLAVSELVTNAVLASPHRGVIRLRGELDGDRCRVEAINHGAPEDVIDALGRAMPSVDQAHGRGLQVARALADRLVVTSPSPGMVTVCFERATVPSGAAADGRA
jgi:anti-sigma regulatory factor (Ser/Thr protein kinase)